MNSQNTGVWIGIVVLVVVAGFGLWWLSMGRPASVATDVVATSTTATTTAETPAKPAPTITRVNRTGSTVNAIIASIDGASQFNALYQSTGMASTIGTGSGTKYTVFVPTNGAISQLPGGTISGMTSAEKKRLIQYHVVSGRAIDVDAQTAGTIQALSGDAINFNYGTNKIPMVNSAIVVTEYDASNGVVYLIDNVLLPPAKARI